MQRERTLGPGKQGPQVYVRAMGTGFLAPAPAAGASSVRSRSVRPEPAAVEPEQPVCVGLREPEVVRHHHDGGAAAGCR